MDWDNPESRLRLIESIGVQEYNRRLSAHIAERPAIYTVNSRFGVLYAVKGSRMAFRTMAEAEAYQRKGGNNG